MYSITPKPRELTKKEINNFKLRYYGGKEMRPAHESTDNVWISMDTGKLFTYRLYAPCTNCLLVLRYTPDKDIWEKVELSDIVNLPSFIWRIIISLKR